MIYYAAFKKIFYTAIRATLKGDFLNIITCIISIFSLVLSFSSFFTLNLREARKLKNAEISYFLILKNFYESLVLVLPSIYISLGVLEDNMVDGEFSNKTTTLVDFYNPKISDFIFSGYSQKERSWKYYKILNDINELLGNNYEDLGEILIRKINILRDEINSELVIINKSLH